MKICNPCKTEKPKTEFHRRSASPDGLAARCKDCQRGYDKARADSPERAAAREAYQRTPRGADASRKAKKAYADRNKDKILDGTRRYRASNPNKTKAHGIVGYAIKRGRLHSEPCEVCGQSEKVHAHHDDYAKPLDVRWLCPAHHIAWHVENGEGLNP